MMNVVCDQSMRETPWRFSVETEFGSNSTIDWTIWIGNADLALIYTR